MDIKHLILTIAFGIIIIGVMKCEGFQCLSKEGFSAKPHYFPQGRNQYPMFPDMNPGYDTFARYCLNRNGDCEMGHRWCTCTEHGGCGWWADADEKTRWIEFGHTLPCSRFRGKCQSIASI